MSEHDGLRMVIFRMGTIFGPSIGMRFHTAVNRFCWQAVLGQPITVWRTAIDQLRPYLDLSDAVRAMLFVLRRQLFDSRVYNVVTLNTTVAEVVQVISAVVPSVQIAYVDSPLMNTLSYYVEGGRFERAGFEFTGSLDRGVRDTVAMLTGARSQLLRELAADRWADSSR
jgi:nucleoside-diphosphate-sugar epimerase